MVFMLPGNILIRKILPHYQLGGTALLFGAFVLAMSAAQNYATIAGLRVLVGASQALIQGISIYTSLWYKRDEVGTRGGKKIRRLILCVTY